MNILDRMWLNHVYRECATLIEVDGLVDEPVFKLTRHLKSLHGKILQYISGGLPPIQWAEFSVSTTKNLNPLLGDGSLPVTPERRKAVAKFFLDLAWSGLGKG